MKNWPILEILRELMLLAISLIMMAMGSAMILVPAPPSFELLTLYYLNPQDGVTVMDLVSLIILFSGAYLFISVFIRFKNRSAERNDLLK